MDGNREIPKRIVLLPKKDERINLSPEETLFRVMLALEDTQQASRVIFHEKRNIIEVNASIRPTFVIEKVFIKFHGQEISQTIEQAFFALRLLFFRDQLTWVRLKKEQKTIEVYSETLHKILEREAEVRELASPYQVEFHNGPMTNFIRRDK